MAKKGKNKFYVVWHGLKTGIFNEWNEVKDYVKYPGSKYKSFDSEEEAKIAFRSGPNYESKPVYDNFISEINTNSISVDAACEGNPGRMEYRGVHTVGAKEIFRMGPFEQGTNNVGEFLAIVHALALLDKSQRHDITIYTDSKTAMAWVRNKSPKTKLERTKDNEPIFELLERAVKWLKAHSIKNPIVKWDTERWGEIPADFGRK